ncbi:hypothetical protein EVJ58_g621 [Rhodofomes roseus]|uniref:Uncharacterized protein n=1 Tax=Rhodofomes roseus TaxID=34475 RepID=A0A4Y9Z3F0_9APHY|nr:hypothetical protein EVJ58_g621 [Rhodofomes roseus]
MSAHSYMQQHTHAHSYGSPSGYPMNTQGHALDTGARYQPTSPVEEPSHAIRYAQQNPHEAEESLQVLAQQYRQPGYPAQSQAAWQQSQNHGQHELRHHASHPQLGMSAASNPPRPLHPYYTVHPHASPSLSTTAAPGHPVLPPLSAPSSGFSSIAGASGSSNTAQDVPALAAHTSLGRNHLPPDSTLLTPLPGYQPEPDVTGLMDVHQRYAQPDDQDDRYARGGSGDGYFD